MQPQSQDRALELFFTVLDMDPADRGSFLDRVCPPGALERMEVEALLRCDEALDSERLAQQIEQAIQSVAMTLAGNQVWIGRRLGAYRITEEIGEGGMGTVFLAERSDDRFERKVAIKLVAAGADSAPLRERLIAERRTLAPLDHPYIAKLIDGGETEEGVPYLVMEYVAGQPIHEYSRSLTRAARAELIEKVCEAVAFAHRSLVVHRDLKPSNILVAEGGVPKLLDFGIAEALDEAGGPRAYTPGYAAPELVAGERVTTAADVYSLGVILRELMGPVGVAPDLAAIVARASAASVNERYLSAEGLRADLQRWRRGFPVTAREQTASYRAVRFVGRHRWAVAASTAAALALGAASGAAVVQARRANAALEAAKVEQGRAESERVRAQMEQRRAEEQAERAEQARATAIREHEAGSKRLRDLVTFADTTLTEINETLEKIAGSTAERRKIVDETLRLLEKEQAEGTNSPELLTAVAAGYNKAATILGGVGHPNLGDAPAALSYLAQSRQLIARLLKDDPDSAKLWQILLESDYLAGSILREQGKKQEAHQVLDTAIALALKRVAARPKEFETLSVIADLEGEDVAAQTDLGRADGSVWNRIQAAIGHIELLRSLRRNDPELTMKWANVHSRKFALQVNRGEVADAVATELKVIGAWEQLIKHHPNNPLALRSLAIAYGKLGDLAGSASFGGPGGDRDAAYGYYRRSIELTERVAKLDSSNQGAQFDAATALLHAGMVDPRPDQIRESIGYLERAVEGFDQLARQSFGPRSVASLANGYEFLAERHGQLGDRAEAARFAMKGLEVIRRVAEQYPANYAITSQLMFSYLAAIAHGGLEMDALVRARLLESAHSAFEQASVKPEFRHMTARLWNAEGRLWQKADPPRACAAYRESLNRWNSIPAVTRFPKEVEAVKSKVDACR